jgi:hypothetical protein
VRCLRLLRTSVIGQSKGVHTLHERPRRGWSDPRRSLTATDRKDLSIMATENPTTIALDIEFLSFTGAQFLEQAEAFKSAAAAKLAQADNLRLAAHVCDRLASLRCDIGEVITKTETTGAFTKEDTMRELRNALENAAREV